MERIYLVKKDPLMPQSEDNWIRMTKPEFIEFLKTPAGKLRKSNFGQINGVDENDVIYIVECDTKMARTLRSEKNKSAYQKQVHKKEKITILSFETPDEDLEIDERGYKDKLYIAEDDVVKDTLKKMDLETLRLAISTLDDEEKWIIRKLFFDEKTMSARELSEMMQIPQKTLHYRKNQIFKKIRKFF